MAPRRLDPAEAALWARVVSAIKPLHPARVAPLPLARLEKHGAPAPKPVRAPVAPAPVAPTRARQPGPTLDASWDRRIARGMVIPDSTLDLHGHTLASAHGLLDQGLARSIQRGDRVLLLVTGKPPRPDSERPHARGAIRSAITDWILAGRHADRVASIRPAHPRHGGQGALYLVLRRER
ncbi:MULTISPECIES: Smr/MutS family protein [unclassified Sphingomonas]|uniref:Smr/MutS family protein n=1 Tax=unclassified Sphingomonas TaxID=196159 RepID=UPI0006FD70D6|nr:MULTISPECIES: Smr/MutS family protein [unclassified Sphingomonas]KQN07249.1 DNA mismatch repair protein MutS [Sphingomonas sp. Leaf25]KQN34238.1 DNA mismatch repair protein MutS [Sphingomonas sp. Leaf42]KQT30681.1 DNA mismatch repair protein MutS [Sphingomonas sp. Leaf407]